MDMPDGKIGHAGTDRRLGGDDGRRGRPEPGDAGHDPPLRRRLRRDVRARARCGRHVGREPTDQFYGDRSAGVRDAAGNLWWIATHVEDVPGELAKRLEEATAGYEVGMRFRKRAKLDPSQVEDCRGQGGGLGGLGGGKILGGGGGIVGIVVLVLYLVVASQGRGLGELGSLAGQTVGPGTPNTELAAECRMARTRTSARIAASSPSSTASRRTGRRRSCNQAARTRVPDGQHGLRRRVVSRGAVLLPRRRLHLHRPRLLRPAEVAARSRGRPARRGVHPRARVRAPRAGRHRASWAARTATRAPGRPGARRAAGGLLRRALGGARARHQVRRGHHAPGHHPGARRGGCRRRAIAEERAEGRVTPESWTHGSSDQRRTWFVRGVRARARTVATRSRARSSQRLYRRNEPDERRDDDPDTDRERDADDREPSGMVARWVPTVADRPHTVPSAARAPTGECASWPWPSAGQLQMTTPMTAP